MLGRLRQFNASGSSAPPVASRTTCWPASICRDPTTSRSLGGDGRPFTVTSSVPGALRLPAASTLLHVTLVVPTGKTDPLAGVQITGVDPETRSVAPACRSTMAPAGRVACTVVSCRVRTGPVVSVTVTVRAFLPTLPAASRAVHTTRVEPRGKVEPDGRSQLTATTAVTASLAVAA